MVYIDLNGIRQILRSLPEIPHYTYSSLAISEMNNKMALCDPPPPIPLINLAMKI